MNEAVERSAMAFVTLHQQALDEKKLCTPKRLSKLSFFSQLSKRFFVNEKSSMRHSTTGSTTTSTTADATRCPGSIEQLFLKHFTAEQSFFRWISISPAGWIVIKNFVLSLLEI